MLYRDCFLKIPSIFLFVLLLISFQMVSCATPQQSYRIQPEFINTIKNVKSIGVIVPTCIVKDLAIGGATTINQGASEAARPMMERGVIGGLEKKGFKSWLITDHRDRQVFLKNFPPIAREIKNHFPGGEVQSTVPSKIEGFEEILK